MKKIVRKSHEKEIAYELSKKVTQTKLGGGGAILAPPVQIGLNPMAINVPRMALNHEKLHFLHCSVRGVRYDLINVLGPFQSYCNHEIF